MSNLISRTELFDELSRVPISQYAVDERTAIYNKINEAKTYPGAQEWIPCSERLPEEYAQYLACDEDGECYVYWLEDAYWARRDIEHEHIVAWMPLPKPYKEEER